MKLSDELRKRVAKGHRAIVVSRQEPRERLGRAYKAKALQVQVTALHQCDLREMTAEDAVCAGFKGQAELYESLGFLPQGPKVPIEVYIMDLALDHRYQPRFLNIRPAPDYTHNPSRSVKGEGEVVPEEWLKDHLADKDRQREAALFKELLEAEEAAKRTGINYARERMAIRKQIKVIQTKARRAA